jgi:hypothetical protein
MLNFWLKSDNNNGTVYLDLQATLHTPQENSPFFEAKAVSNNNCTERLSTFLTSFVAFELITIPE